MKKNIARFSCLLLVAAAFSIILGCASTATRESTGQYVDDTTITTKVKAALLNEPNLKSAEINVETYKGTVQLSGFASTRTEIRKAVSVTEAVDGVKAVRNDMLLK